MITGNNKRVDIRKTHKLFIGGTFPRSESGRTFEATNTNGEFLANMAMADENRSLLKMPDILEKSGLSDMRRKIFAVTVISLALFAFADISSLDSISFLTSASARAFSWAC
jgi:hypothetical protein